MTPDNQKIRCSLRGKFKKQFSLKKDKLHTLDVAAVGDFVKVDLSNDGTGAISEIEDRKNHLSRKAIKMKGASFRGERFEQVIASNVDNLFIVSSIVKPEFNNKVIDRIIVAGESSHLNTFIIINKVDIDSGNVAGLWEELYTSIGYKVFLTSAKSKIGIEDLRNEIHGKVNLFWGSSGVGKSSILNELFPDLELETGDISESSYKGKHTTVTSILNKVDDETYVIDTPGIREIDPYGIKKEDLGHYFIDFAPFFPDCRFNTCTHYHEPGCAVVDAVEKGEIDELRYESYLNILDTIEDDMNF